MTSYLLVRLHSLLSPSPPTPRKKIYIGSRASKLALIQTNIVRDALMAAHPELDFEIISMTTAGDNNQTKPLHSFGAKALWTQELEVLLLERKVDLIVHSLKDMPTQLPPGCELGAILEREDPRDALVMKDSSVYTTLASLPSGSTIGTSSVRRSAQLSAAYPHLRFADVRGNVGTRLSKLDDPTSPYSCLILASAGLIRLGLGDRITAPISAPTLLHAVGQGALGVEIREGDEMVDGLVGVLRCSRTTRACMAERELMRVLEGGCSVPIGVETGWRDGDEVMYMRAVVASLDGGVCVRVEEEMTVESVEEAVQFGKVVAGRLVEGGAEEVLKEINRNRAPVV